MVIWFLGKPGAGYYSPRVLKIIAFPGEMMIG